MLTDVLATVQWMLQVEMQAVLIYQ